MPRNLITLDRPNPIRHRLLGVAAVSIAALGCAGAAASDAQALTVTSDASGLKMIEPGFTRADIKLTLVNAGGVKYRVETPNFGQSAITTGVGCVNQSTVGTAVALCNRVKPIVSEVSLGPSRDKFAVDPTFPDPIVVNDTQSGPDSYQLGAASDFARGGTGDEFIGAGGNDDMATRGGKLDGGEGNDTLRALNQRDFTNDTNDMLGGPGNDTLTAEGVTLVGMVGGEGTDTFDLNGSRGFVDSRDGVKEQVSCGKRKRFLRLINSGRPRRRAIVDLTDAPNDASLIKGGCATVDRAPNGEKTAAQLVRDSAKLRRGKAGVKVKCTTRARCRGRISLKVKGRTSSMRYSIRGRRTATLRLTARRGTAALSIKEKGRKGSRTTRAALKVTR